MGGYVGNSADVKRIRKLTEAREAERKRVEGLIHQSEDAVEGAGLRKFGVGTSEVLESVFKAETIGLVTKEQFVEKRETLKERYELEEKRKAEEEAERKRKEKEKRKKQKQKLESQRAKLSFAEEVEEDEEAEEEEEARKPKKVVYDVKKKKAQQKKEEEEKAAVEAARKAAEEEEARAKAAAEAKAEAEAKAAVEVQESEESEADEWDAVDVDNLKIPVAQNFEDELQREEAEKAAKAKAKALKEAAKKAAKETEEGSEEEDSEEEDSSGDDDSDSDSSEYSGSSDYSDSSEDEQEQRKREAKARREARMAQAQASKSKEDLRSPICCILGHVDTGKTKILDNVRRTNVQDGEAGGITQQIGATYVPCGSIEERTTALRTPEQPKSQGKALDLSGPFDMKMPGLLIIDTPGHESFTNLRARGSGLCDIAVLVVDMMHGMEQQTIESINLLKMRKTPFIVALNKIDRLYDWNTVKDLPIQQALAKQKKHVVEEFQQRWRASQTNLNEQGLNVALYWENPDPRKFINIVPTSAITGEGIPDLLQLLVKLSQTMMTDRLSYITELQCTVLEVKVVEGLGTTIDVILVNGVIHEGDTIVVCGLQGPIVTTIRSLLTPHPMKEIRVKGQYLHHKEVKAAQGIKISANGLESAVAGTALYVVGPDDDVEELKEEVMGDMQNIFDSVDKSGEGVYVQASTLGSLEALLSFLKTDAVKIPVSAINIGPVHKRDIMRAGVMLEKKMKKFGVILAFDVPVSKEAADLAEEMGVRIMTADIIYHLFDQFSEYLKECKAAEQEAAKFEAVFPCRLKIVPTCIFNKKDPIVLGVEVVEGVAKIGTPLCIPSQGKIDLGRIGSMEKEHKAVDVARVGDMIAMKIDSTNATESSRLYGRHFDHTDELVSKLTRKSIDLLKENFRDEMTKPDWQLVIKLKKVFQID
mmetsp:Transcript_29073/g.72845  ORF Transcript_29073/g.72845 Transcript_29073/m.72845 type:complete len:931 (-) Transcript_29073:481-3273(-)